MNAATVWGELLKPLLLDFGVRKCQKVNFILLCELHKLMIGAQLVTFLQRVGESGKYDKQLHEDGVRRVGFVCLRRMRGVGRWCSVYPRLIQAHQYPQSLRCQKGDPLHFLRGQALWVVSM